MRHFAFLLACLWTTALCAQALNFTARWATHPTASPLEYGVFHFRKTLDVGATPPTAFPVYVSADNRYKLYVNGVLVSLGPTRGDLLHWRYAKVDLAPYLRAGTNVIAATVWNFGEHKPAAQISLSTAFLLQVVDEDGVPVRHALNSGKDWQVHHNLAYSPELTSGRVLQTYAVVGPNDIVDAAAYPWGWQMGTDTATWVLAKAGPAANTYGNGTDGGRYLVPDTQAPQRMDTTPWGRFRRADTGNTTGRQPRVDTTAGGVLEALTVPPRTTMTVLLDHAVLATGYPAFAASGGAGATVEVSYAEAMVDAAGQKGHRDSIAGRRLVGFTDRYVLDGSKNRRFETLWWRTWRYIELRIVTGSEAVELSGFAARRTGYPLVQTATIDTDVPWINDVWETGWRTQELCAHETFVDCPYYEQLQYVGDTRIQALITLYNTGDATLMRRAIQDFSDSKLPFGLTQSRYPSDKLQVIPPYSLAWVNMVYDYHLHVDDEAFVREQLDGIRAVLKWHKEQLNDNGLMGKTPWWNFVDWTVEWPWDESLRVGGVPPQTEDGESTVLTLQYAYTLALANELFGSLDMVEEVDSFALASSSLMRSTNVLRNSASSIGYSQIHRWVNRTLNMRRSCLL